MSSTIIVTPKFENRQGICRSSVVIRGAGLDLPDLTYEFSGDLLPRAPLVNDFAAVCLLPLAMKRGVPLHIEGRVSMAQLERLEEAQDAWVRWHPKMFKPIKVTADEEVGDPVVPTSRRAMIAYSGGLDATYALHAHCTKMLGRRTNDIAGAVMVHGFDVPLARSGEFERAKAMAEKIVGRYGVPLTTVRTNFKALGLPWGQTFIFGVASVLHHYSGTVARGVIAADECYDSEVLGWGSNSVSNPLVGSGAFPIDFTGAGASRVDKARALRNEPVVLENLRVCYEAPGAGQNCGECEKCTRTKLNFLVSGVGEVPALGPLSIDAINRIRTDKPAVRALFVSMLRDGDWTGHEDVRAAVEKVARPESEGMLGRARRFVMNALRHQLPRKVRHFRRKHLKWLLPT